MTKQTTKANKDIQKANKRKKRTRGRRALVLSRTWCANRMGLPNESSVRRKKLSYNTWVCNPPYR
ncbi:hypothetical protein L873DRAFT_1816285 [Choiromyces venosus 120613-1]|uniref:Uncharacterized protein n=1 Tax=Choiromyces venosus 120613-1 TaxID=1336337 RepID=A0A3N4JHC7_9PEZI|nr:hypothetical protein L873DRAFT_1816285 [Choiromyces venosus 120613-1]